MGSEGTAHGLAGCKAQYIIFILLLVIDYRHPRQWMPIHLPHLSSWNGPKRLLQPLAGMLGPCVCILANWLAHWNLLPSSILFSSSTEPWGHRMKMVAPPCGRGSLNDQVEHARATIHLNNVQWTWAWNRSLLCQGTEIFLLFPEWCRFTIVKCFTFTNVFS